MVTLIYQLIIIFINYLAYKFIIEIKNKFNCFDKIYCHNQIYALKTMA